MTRYIPRWYYQSSVSAYIKQSNANKALFLIKCHTCDWQLAPFSYVRRKDETNKNDDGRVFWSGCAIPCIFKVQPIWMFDFFITYQTFLFLLWLNPWDAGSACLLWRSKFAAAAPSKNGLLSLCKPTKRSACSRTPFQAYWLISLYN